MTRPTASSSERPTAQRSESRTSERDRSPRSCEGKAEGGRDFGKVLRDRGTKTKEESPQAPRGPKLPSGGQKKPAELRQPAPEAGTENSLQALEGGRAEALRRPLGDPGEAAAELGRKLKDALGEPTTPLPAWSPAPGLPQPIPAGVVTGPGAAALPPPEVLQGLVEFAALTRNRDGHYEFRMGLDKDLMGGLRIGLVGYGEGRLGLRVKPGAGREVDGAEVERLVEALREKGIEVVDVEGL